MTPVPPVPGNAGLLDQRVPFLAGADIPPGAEDSYFAPTVSDELASVYEHAARSIDHSLRVVVHGLPLMGSGDWNDGMNRVDAGGHGESVWLGWLLCQVVSDFMRQAQARGEAERVARWTLALQSWRAALLGPGWDGQWFRRAYFDDGSPLGSAGNAEAKIDLIAQAWAVLSGQAPPDKARRSLASVKAHLADESAGLLRLLDPPFVHSDPSPGYIQAYPPGVRENGGQYTHGGVWAVMAQAALGTDPDLAWRWFTWLSPAHRAADPLHGAVYGLEPYAVAGDVFSQPPHTGRGGWSWYTGAASWLHRAAVESIFGLNLQATTLSFRPSLPSRWPRAELTLRRDGRMMRFMLVRATPAQVLAAAATSGADAAATLLLPGQVLAWTTLQAHSCFVLPLLAGATAEAGSVVAESVRSPSVRSIDNAPSVLADQA